MADESIFQQYELDAYLGDFAGDFDVEAIVDVATYVDPKTGNRFWKDGIDLAAICERYDLSSQE